MGSPEWYWSAAKEQFSAGDYMKTQEHLEKLMATSNEFKDRAATWHLVLLAGMASGFRDLAEAYGTGAGAAKAQASDFRRTASEMQRYARQYSIGLAEEAGRFSKQTAGAQQFSLDFTFPSGTPTEPAALERVKQGMFPQEADLASIQRQMVARGVLLKTAAMAGAAGDPAKAGDMFKTLPVQVPRAAFLLGLGESLVEESAIFDRKKLNEPDKKRFMLQLAADCLKPGTEGGDAAGQKKAKDLIARIEKEQKALPKS
jgi:hypothetical protein